MSAFDDENGKECQFNNFLAWELIKSGNSDQLREMLIKGEISDINACIRRDDQPTTLLMTASMYGRYDCVKLLLEYGADKAILCERYIHLQKCFVRSSALFLASCMGHIDIVKLLLEHGAELNSSNCSPLCGACLAGKLELTKFLIDLGAEVNSPSVLNSHSTTTPIIVAARNGNIELIEYLIEKGADVHYKQSDQNALIEACSGDHLLVVEVLLHHGADINIHLQSNKTTCMHQACSNDYTEMVEFLLEHGADVNAVDQYHTTPFAIAFDKRNNELITILLEHGADPNCGVIESSNGWTPLMNAVYDNDTEMMRLLLQYDADINSGIQTEEGGINKYIKVWSPLLIACEHGCIDAAKLLIEHGADVNQIFNNYNQNDTTLICLFRAYSWTPLGLDTVGDEGEGYIDLTADQLTCLKLLLEHGADVTVTNSIRNTVFDYVKDRPGIIKLLNEYVPYTEPILK